MNVYEQNKFLYGFDELIGKRATLYYLPTKCHRKWRTAWSVTSYSEAAYDAAMELLRQNNWFTFEFAESL